MDCGEWTAVRPHTRAERHYKAYVQWTRPARGRVGRLLLQGDRQPAFCALHCSHHSWQPGIVGTLPLPAWTAPGRIVQVAIVDAQQRRDISGQRFGAFTIRALVATDGGSNSEATCERRYTDFVALHAELHVALALPAAFPVVASALAFLSTRSQQLQEYLHDLVARSNATSAPPPLLPLRLFSAASLHGDRHRCPRLRDSSGRRRMQRGPGYSPIPHRQRRSPEGRMRAAAGHRPVGRCTRASLHTPSPGADYVIAQHRQRRCYGGVDQWRQFVCDAGGRGARAGIVGGSRGGRGVDGCTAPSGQHPYSKVEEPRGGWGRVCSAKLAQLRPVRVAR